MLAADKQLAGIECAVLPPSYPNPGEISRKSLTRPVRSPYDGHLWSPASSWAEILAKGRILWRYE